MMRSIAALLSAVAVGIVLAAPVDDARALFDRYVALEKQFDPAVADLYADDAVIKTTRTYPDGQVRDITMPVLTYKGLIRSAMPVAKSRGDTSTYSRVTYTEEGPGVRIRALRFSNLKKYSSPLSLLVAPDTSGRWRIREELSETQP